MEKSAYNPEKYFLPFIVIASLIVSMLTSLVFNALTYGRPASADLVDEIPKITSIKPNSAVVGSPDTAVVVDGNNFKSGNDTTKYKSNPKLCFDLDKCLTTIYISPIQLTAVIPKSYLVQEKELLFYVVNYPVSLTSGIASINSVRFTVTAKLPSPLAPIITNLTPNSGLVDTQILVDVNGTNFTNKSQVFLGSDGFDDILIVPQYISSTELRIIIPKLSAKMYTVTVWNPIPGSALKSLSVPFTVTAEEDGLNSMLGPIP